MELRATRELLAGSLAHAVLLSWTLPPTCPPDALSELPLTAESTVTFELAALTPVSFPDPTVVDARPAGAAAAYELGLAPRSEHNLYEGFDGLEGVFVATWEPPPLGAAVELTLHLPGGARVVVQGVAAFERAASRDAHPGVGVRFQGLDEADHKTLALFAKLREPLFYG